MTDSGPSRRQSFQGTLEEALEWLDARNPDSSVVMRLRERAKWLESRSFATLDGSIEREAADTIERLLTFIRDRVGAGSAEILSKMQVFIRDETTTGDGGGQGGNY